MFRRFHGLRKEAAALFKRISRAGRNGAGFFLRLEVFDLYDLLDAAARELQPAASAAGTELLVSIARRVPRLVAGYPEGLLSVLSGFAGGMIAAGEAGWCGIAVGREGEDTEPFGPRARLVFSVRRAIRGADAAGERGGVTGWRPEPNVRRRARLDGLVQLMDGVFIETPAAADEEFFTAFRLRTGQGFRDEPERAPGLVAGVSFALPFHLPSETSDSTSIWYLRTDRRFGTIHPYSLFWVRDRARDRSEVTLFSIHHAASTL